MSEQSLVVYFQFPSTGDLEPLLALEDDGLGRFLLDRLDAALAASLGTDPAVDGAQA